MAVYTKISQFQLQQFLLEFDLGELISFEGIKDGIDNSNYFVKTSAGDFVVTLFESLTSENLPVFLNLLSHLDHHNISCPSPRLNLQSEKIALLNDKPAAVFNRLTGKATKNPTKDQCQSIGLALAKLHLCTQNYSFPIKNDRDLEWCKAAFHEINTHLTSQDCVLIKDELEFQSENYPTGLSRGVIHGDLFRDNVLFSDNKVSGLLDFYDASHENLLLDIAITANDWCVENGKINQEKVRAMLFAYESLRPLQSREKYHWNTLLRLGALRFWLSRLHHQISPRFGELTQQKNPLVFRQLLEQHRQQNHLSEIAG